MRLGVLFFILFLLWVWVLDITLVTFSCSYDAVICLGMYLVLSMYLLEIQAYCVLLLMKCRTWWAVVWPNCLEDFSTQPIKGHLTSVSPSSYITFLSFLYLKFPGFFSVVLTTLYPFIHRKTHMNHHDSLSSLIIRKPLCLFFTLEGSIFIHTAFLENNVCGTCVWGHAGEGVKLTASSSWYVGK